MKLSLDGRSLESLNWELTGEGGFFTGARVMTTLLRVGQRFVDFDRHIDRLSADAEIMGIGPCPAQEVWKFDAQALVDAQPKSERYRVRLILFKDAFGVTRRVVVVDAVTATRSDTKEALRLDTMVDKSWSRGAHIKTGIVGRREAELSRARSRGFDDILWVNSEQELVEATWANIFLLGRTGDLVEIATPPESSGILPGITRARIIDLLQASGIPVTIRPITLDEVPRFDEAFLTSSIQGVVAVGQIGRHKLPTLRGSSVFRHIRRLYQTWLSLDNDYDQGPTHQPMLS